jgi:hypothetical protein
MVICYGIANTIIYSHGPFHCFDAMHRIAKAIHPQLDEMLSCFICSGWWLGFFMSGLNILFVPEIRITPMNMIGLPIEYWYVTVFLDGAFVSGSNWLINTIQDALERSGNHE